ncbi:hypothetical protein ACFVAF_31380 [Streptomyces sp. NPDC057596]|uniref:hypothetical protein n=1 Tax=Streptomyces sp. NPDC057596 TaxID=3346178 RepID=UPI0036A06FDC
MNSPSGSHRAKDEDAERAARAEQARASLREWNGYDLGRGSRVALDAELDRRIGEARAR